MAFVLPHILSIQMITEVSGIVRDPGQEEIFHLRKEMNVTRLLTNKRF